MSELKVLVTGATGVIGIELVNLLASDPAIGEVRAATRNPQSDAAKLLCASAPGKVRAVQFDDQIDDSLAAAVNGVDVVCLITPLGGDMAAWQDRVVAHLKGVRRVLKVSVDAAREDAEPGTLGADHWHGEEAVRSLSAEFGIIRPTIFMQHFMMVPGLYLRGDDTFYLPIGDAGIAMLDARDISACLAAMVQCERAELPTEPAMVTGPEALTGEHLRKRISWASGKNFSWTREPSEFDSHSEAVGSPKMVGEIYQAGANGAFSEIHTQGFERLVGRKPRSFARFASDYAAYFQ